MNGGAGDEIAIVGMACRVPGAETPGALWRNVCEGITGIRRFPASPGLVPIFGRLDGLELFDAGFFGVDDQTARLMDPQQRMFLEVCWHALEDAGIDPGRSGRQIGVFGGGAPVRYQRDFALNGLDHLATRVAYHLGLSGPAISVQSACSSSLVAVCLAAQSLNDFRCDVALAGGAAVVSTVEGGYVHREGAMTSPDGTFLPLDDRTTGSVFGNGAGVVVLKRLADAEADNDFIHGVLRGWAVGNDGSQRAGYTAPGMEGQAAAMLEALRAAEIEAGTIGLAELHAAGTRLGDAVELAALARAFKVDTARTGFCAAGATKTTTGNLDAAAGVVGLIKAVLAVREAVLPGLAGFGVPNAEVDWQANPCYVPKSAEEWVAPVRRALVNSFGLGGTNASVVVEQGPYRTVSEDAPATVTLSARSLAALTAMRERLREHLLTHPTLALADVAYTLRVGRRAMPHRWSATCADLVHATSSLESVESLAAEELSPDARRVPLPGYPFERSRYWVDEP